MENLIKKCRLDEIINLRMAELRKKAQSQFDAQFESDFDLDTYHFGVFNEKGESIGCATFKKGDLILGPIFIPNCYQLRGMATRSDLQKSGIGGQILEFAEKTLLKENPWLENLWCNARISAQKFYKKNGWEETGSPFAIKIEGEEIPHIRMFKVLRKK